MHPHVQASVRIGVLGVVISVSGALGAVGVQFFSHLEQFKKKQFFIIRKWQRTIRLVISLSTNSAIIFGRNTLCPRSLVQFVSYTSCMKMDKTSGADNRVVLFIANILVPTYLQFSLNEFLIQCFIPNMVLKYDGSSDKRGVN